MKLYHRVPQDIKGDSLMPLNKLKRHDEELFDQYHEKYIGREAILDIKIPYLHCLWNDVIHMSPVHPSKIVSVLSDLGFEELSKIKWFEICPEKCGFTSDNTVIFLYKTPLVPLAGRSEYEPFDVKKLEILSNLKPEVVEYYQHSKTEGKRPLLFHLVPHVLHQGVLRLDCLDEIEA